MNKPVIGVTGPDRGGTASWLFIRWAVFLQGGKAVYIRPSRPRHNVELDGVILGGGADIDPSRYNQSILNASIGKRDSSEEVESWFNRFISLIFFPFLFLIRKLFSIKSTAVDPQRDDLEFAVLKKALENEIPVLGICRGYQLINIYFGGDLHQDIGNFYGEIPRIYSVLPKKKIKLKPDSKLSSIFGKSRIAVNALHHQAVKKMGENLQIVAWEENGVVQAAEHKSHPFLIGVQWHPEYMPQLEHQRKIFRKLVAAAKR